MWYEGRERYPRGDERLGVSVRCFHHIFSLAIFAVTICSCIPAVVCLEASILPCCHDVRRGSPLVECAALPLWLHTPVLHEGRACPWSDPCHSKNVVGFLVWKILAAGFDPSAYLAFRLRTRFSSLDPYTVVIVK